MRIYIYTFLHMYIHAYYYRVYSSYLALHYHDLVLNLLKLNKYKITSMWNEYICVYIYIYTYLHMYIHAYYYRVYSSYLALHYHDLVLNLLKLNKYKITSMWNEYICVYIYTYLHMYIHAYYYM